MIAARGRRGGRLDGWKSEMNSARTKRIFTTRVKK